MDGQALLSQMYDNFGLLKNTFEYWDADGSGGVSSTCTQLRKMSLSICVSVSVCLSICASLSLSICLSQSLCLCLMLSLSLCRC